MFQTLGFPAGGRQINALGNFFRYESCSANGADETIRVRADGNDLGTYLPGDYIDLGPLKAKQWEVTPLTGSATGVVRIGNGTVNSSRLTGYVRIVDSSSDKTLAGAQFIGSQGRAASVGLGGIAGLRAGKLTAVKRITVWSSIAGTFQLYSGNGNPTTGLVTGAAVNKLIGGSAGNATMVSGTTAGANPVAGDLPGAAALVGYSLLANAPYDVPLTTPIIVPIGSVLVVASSALNRDIFAAFDFEES